MYYIHSLFLVYNTQKKLDESRGQGVDIVSNLSAVSEEYAASAEQTSISVTEVNASVQEIAANTDSLQKIVEELKGNLKHFIYK